MGITPPANLQSRPSFEQLGKQQFGTSVRQLPSKRPPTNPSVPFSNQPVSRPPVAPSLSMRLGSATDLVVVGPSALRFTVSNSACEDFISLHNKGMHPVAFKVRVNVKNMFTLSDAGGILMGGEHKSLSVVMRVLTEYARVDDIPSSKFLIELVAADDGYNILGAKEFWASKNGAEIAKKQVAADFLMPRR